VAPAAESARAEPVAMERTLAARAAVN
jgi:hypothetical protein